MTGSSLTGQEIDKNMQNTRTFVVSQIGSLLFAVNSYEETDEPSSCYGIFGM